MMSFSREKEREVSKSQIHRICLTNIIPAFTAHSVKISDHKRAVFVVLDSNSRWRSFRPEKSSLLAAKQRAR